MALKEKAELICPPQYAYGDDGVPPYVPPSETQRNRSAKHLPKREPRSRSSMKRRRLKQLRIQKKSKCPKLDAEKPHPDGPVPEGFDSTVT